MELFALVALMIGVLILLYMLTMLARLTAAVERMAASLDPQAEGASGERGSER